MNSSSVFQAMPTLAEVFPMAAFTIILAFIFYLQACGERKNNRKLYEMGIEEIRKAYESVAKLNEKLIDKIA